MPLRVLEKILQMKAPIWCFLGKQAQGGSGGYPILNNEELSTRKVSYDYKIIFL